jgi:vancomycin resistance protein YoaR
MDMKKRTILAVALVIVLGMGSIPAGYVYATGENWSSIIYPGVYIEDIDMSGKSTGEAEELIQKRYGDLLTIKKIEIYAGEKVYVLDYSKLEAKYNISETVEEAFKHGKKENVIKRYRLIKGSQQTKFKLAFSYNSKALDELVNKIESELNTNPSSANISVINGTVKITPEVNGVKVEKDKLRKTILENINGDISKEYVKIDVPIEITKPEITSEKLSNINGRISSFSTSFTGSAANRISNIELATKAINGTLLMPGESFSFNETVGERTKERGYKEAGVIIGDKLESGLGGGICQVSSTLYAALLNTDIKAFERINHTLPLGYISKGLDATVDWGNIDFKFKNTLDVPIYLEGYIKDKNVYFNVYSSQELARKSYELAAEVYETVQPTVKYIDDPNRYEGEEVVVKKAAVGYKVKVYRKTYENESIVNTELISRDYYMPVSGEIIRGTKKRS